MRLPLHGESGAEADGGNTNGNPAELVGDSDDAAITVSGWSGHNETPGIYLLLKP